MANWQRNANTIRDIENPSRVILQSARAYTVETLGGKTFRPFDPNNAEIFHMYNEDEYIGQVKGENAAKESFENVLAAHELKKQNKERRAQKRAKRLTR